MCHVAAGGGGNRSICLRCLVERTKECRDVGAGESSSVEVDTTVNVLALTPFHDLVHAVLVSIGYTDMDVVGSKGSTTAW